MIKKECCLRYLLAIFAFMVSQNLCAYVVMANDTDGSAIHNNWEYVNRDFDKSIAFKKIRVQNMRVSSGVYCCVFFSTKANDNTTSDTKYNINFNRLTLGDGVEQDDYKGYIYINTCKSVGNNWYEYEFKQPVYFSHYQTNAPQNQVMALVDNSNNEGNASVGQRFYSNGIQYEIINGESVMMTWQWLQGDIEIPSKVTYNGKTYNVTSIAGGDREAENEPCEYMTSLIIPNSVKTIGSEAFAPCTGLKTLTIGSSVESIGGGAFFGCVGLRTVISTIGKPFVLSNMVFWGIPSDAELIVPKGTKAAYQSTAGWNVFSKITEGINSSADIEFAQSGINYQITSTNTVAVKSVSSSLKNIDIPEYVYYNGITYRVTSIGWRAFADHSDITYLSIPNSITSIGEYAFIDCGSSMIVNIADLESWCKVTFENLQSNPLTCAKALYLNGIEIKNLKIPTGVTSISNYAFYQCRSITSLLIPGTVTSIGSSAFEDCTGLSSISLSNGLNYIGGSSFESCSGVSSITLPGTINTIALNAFKNCNSLNTIISEIQKPFAIEGNVFTTYSTTSLIVPAGTKSAYQSAAGWNKFQNIIEVKPDEANFTIGGIAYEGLRSAKTVVAKSVDNQMASVEIPASVSYDGVTFQVTGVAEDAFDGSSMAALVWDVESALPNNAFSQASIGSNFLLFVKSASYAPSSVKNVIVNGTASTIRLSDDGGQFYCPKTFTAGSISYIHSYSMETGGEGKGWETVALPFDVQRIVHGSRGEIVPFASYSSGTSQRPFWLACMSASGFRKASVIQAYEPYIIAMPNNSKYRNEYNLAGDVTFSADNVQVMKTPAFSGLFMPAFTVIPKSSTVYALNVNNRYVKYAGSYEAGSRFISNLRDIRPFEAYISDSSTRGVIEIGFDDDTTDMAGIPFRTDQEDEISVYTLSGQQVARTTLLDYDHLWQQLPKGIYIVNGEKRIK